MLYSWLTSFAAPFPWLFVVTVAGLLWLWRRRVEPRRRLLWIAVPLTMLWVFSMPLTAYWALRTLEAHYPPSSARPDHTRAIVVLAGGIRPPDSVVQEAVLADDTLLRCLHAAKLYHSGPPCLVLLSGGKVNPSDPGPQLAEAMRDLMLMLGIRAEDIVLESSSRSTYENAVESARILKEKLHIDRVLLVTDAAHLLRAAACFRAEGIAVDASGCRYRATELRWSLGMFFPQPYAAAGTNAAVHEWLGLLWYRLRRRI